MGPDQLPEGHDDAALDAGVDDVVDAIGDVDAVPRGCDLDRTGSQRTTSPPLPVGLGDNEADVVARVDECFEGRDGGVGRAEEGELQEGRSRLRNAFIAALR